MKFSASCHGIRLLNYHRILADIWWIWNHTCVDLQRGPSLCFHHLGNRFPFFLLPFCLGSSCMQSCGRVHFLFHPLLRYLPRFVSEVGLILYFDFSITNGRPGTNDVRDSGSSIATKSQAFGSITSIVCLPGNDDARHFKGKKPPWLEPWRGERW